MRKRLFAWLLIGVLTAFSSQAQEQPPAEEPPTPPDLANLQSDWWSYFENLGDEQKQALVEPYLQTIEARVASLRPSDQEVALSILAAIRDNLAAYGELLKESAEAAVVLAAPDEGYTIEQLLEVAAESRKARADADEQQVEVEREQRILQGARERRDVAYNRYRGAAAGDEKFIAALRLIQNRSALAIATRRLQLLTERSQQATAYAAATAERVELAIGLLPTTVSEEEMASLQEDVDKAIEAIDRAADRLQAAEIAASRLALDTPQGRSQQRLDRQKLIEAQIVHALERLRWMKANSLRIWALLLLGDAPDTAELRDLSVGARDYVRNLRSNIPEWRQDTADELLAAQTTSRDGLNRAARRLLDQRVGTAQISLTRIGEVEAAAEELELLSVVAENAFVENVGTLQSWMAITSRFFRESFQRIGQLADTTLFSIGETPVAGSDILRFLIILLVAYALSRLVRHAVARIGRSEEAGTQASLYTVGRLSHYTIFTIAVIVALSTIGLDFSNIALVAGALGVGIGFGLQSIVSNFVSGLIILFEHSLRVGDYIELDTGLTGTVKAINVRSTLINTNDNIDIVVPNSEFVSNRLTNWTLAERILRMRIPFGVAYGSDKELVRKAAIEAAGEVQYTLKNLRGREPDVWLVEYGDSSLNFLLLVWVNRQGARRPTRTRAAYLWAMEDKFREYGIEIPFPQRDLNLRSGWQAAPGGAAESPVEEQPDPG